jgi:hypothetical protein
MTGIVWLRRVSILWRIVLLRGVLLLAILLGRRTIALWWGRIGGIIWLRGITSLRSILRLRWILTLRRTLVLLATAVIVSAGHRESFDIEDVLEGLMKKSCDEKPTERWGKAVL